MKNFSLQPVFDTMQSNINIILGEYAKTFIEQNDYDMLALIAKIGENTTTYFEELSDIIHYGEEGSNDIVTIDEPEVIEAEVVNEKVDHKNETLSQEVYSQMKTFIFNYIGKRGGKTTVKDLALVFHEEFKSHFTDYHYRLVNGSVPKWQHKMYDQVKTMRTNGLIAPRTSGADYNYYILTPKALKTYNRAAFKVGKAVDSSKHRNNWLKFNEGGLQTPFN